MHLLITTNAFKNNLNAQRALKAKGKGIQLSKLGCSCTIDKLQFPWQIDYGWTF